MFATCECFTSSDSLRKCSECKVGCVEVENTLEARKWKWVREGGWQAARFRMSQLIKGKNDNKTKEESKCEGDEHTRTGVLPSSVNSLPSLLDLSIFHYLPPFPSISVPLSPPIQPLHSFILLSLPHHPQFPSSPSISSFLHQPQASPFLPLSPLPAARSPRPSPNCLSQIHLSPTRFLDSLAPSFPPSLSVPPDNCVQALVRVPPPRTN